MEYIVQPDPNKAPVWLTCLACEREKCDRCWVRWADYLSGTAYRCDCDCKLELWRK